MRRRGERGSAVVEFVWLGILLLVPLVYILLAVFDVQRAAFGAEAASRAAARAFVLAPDQPTAYARAEQAARMALDDQQIHRDIAEVTIRCSPDPQRCLTPGAAVTVVVRVRQPLPIAPEVLGGGALHVRVDSTHIEPYGTFREDRS